MPFLIGSANVEIKAVFTKEPEPVVYSTVSVEGGEHITGEGKNIVITVKRDHDDGKTYRLFTGAAMDRKEIAAGNYTTGEGSLILTLKASAGGNPFCQPVRPAVLRKGSAEKSAGRPGPDPQV